MKERSVEMRSVENRKEISMNELPSGENLNFLKKISQKEFNLNAIITKYE